MMRPLIYLVVFIFFFILYVRLLENKTLFVPAKEILSDPSEIGLDFEDVMFKTQDGAVLNGWFIKSPGAKATFVFSHGNAGNIGDRLAKLRLFYDVGVNVFIYDYRGYGKSQGSPTEERMYLDVRAAYDYLMSRHDIDKEGIVSYGASLGGAAAIDLAVHRDVAAVIIDSSFSNAVDMAQRIFPFIPAFLVRLELDNIRKTKDMDTPKLFFHSKDDDVVPYDLGKKLYDAAAQPKEFVDLVGDHNDGHIHSADIFKSGIEQFLAKHKLL